MENIIVMKVGPHSDMSLEDIILSKKEEEKIHGVHYWGYSGVFCQPKKTQQFCEHAVQMYGVAPKLILIETKSAYTSSIGMISRYSEDGKIFKEFLSPVQLQGAQFSFVAKNLMKLESFDLDNYLVVGGKNDGKVLSQHLRYRVNKCFGIANTEKKQSGNNKSKEEFNILTAELVYPYAIWLRE